MENHYFLTLELFSFSLELQRSLLELSRFSTHDNKSNWEFNFFLASGDDEQMDNKTKKNSQTDLRQRSRSQSDFRQTPKEIIAKPERIPTGTKRKALNSRSGKYIHTQNEQENSLKI